MILLFCAVRMRFRFNPFQNWTEYDKAPAAQARDFHRTLPGYVPTPLRVLRTLATELGLREIHVKDESYRFNLNSFKGLGASWAMHLIGPAATFSAATEGNHGRAVAWMARLMSSRAVVFLPSKTNPARVDAIRSEGAEIHLIEGTYTDTVRQCAAQSEANGWQVVSDTGYAGYLEIPNWVMQGYRTLFDEYEEQRTAAPDLVIIQAGVGGLLCSAARHFSACEDPPKIVCVEPEEADCLLESISSPDGSPRAAKGTQDSMMGCLNCSEVSLTAWPEIRSRVDCFVAIEDSFAREAITRFAQPHPGDPRMNSGESGATGLGGLIAICSHAELRKKLGLSSATRVLLVNTEGVTSGPEIP